MDKKITELLDEFHYHEALDRVHMIACIIEDHLIQHPVCKVDKEISKPIEEALFLLADAYQKLGNKSIKNEQK
jgi:hypothetical protein